MRSLAASPQRVTGRGPGPLDLPLARGSFTRWRPPADRRPARSVSALPARPAGEVAGPIRLVLRHVVRHSVFAEYDCDHCSRSYGRAMARYHH